MKKFNTLSLIFIAIAILFGIAIPVLMPSAAIKLAIPILGAIAVAVAWSARSESKINHHLILALFCAPAIVLSVIWPRYIFLHIGGIPGVNPFTLSALVTSAICMMALIKSKSFSSDVLATFKSGGSISWIAIAWIAWRLVTSATGESPFSSIVEYLRDLLYVGTFLLIGLVAATNPNGPNTILRLITLCAILVDAIGIYEFTTLRNPFFQFISESPDGTASKAIASIVSDKIRDGTARSQSVFDHPIVFAQFSAAIFPISAYLLRHDLSRIWKATSLLALMLSPICIVISGSRSGVVGLAAAVLILGLIWWFRSLREGRLSRIIAIMVVPVIFSFSMLLWYALTELISGRNQHEASSTLIRLGMLKSGIDSLWDSPILGFGYGSAVYKAGVTNTFGIPTIDNYYLSIAVDSGYVGLFLMMVIFIGILIKTIAFAARFPTNSGNLAGTCAASLAALVTIFAGLSIYQNMTLFWILFSCALASLTTHRTHTRSNE